MRDSFALPIDLGNRLLDYAVAARIRDRNPKKRLDISRGFEAYGVSTAVACPLRNHEGLWVRRMDRGFSGPGFKFDVVGENILFVYSPQPYRPGDRILV